MVQYGQTQIVDEAADLLDFSSSCIDLIFFSQDYLVFNFGVTNSGENSSLHPNCLSLTNIFFQIRLKIYYPPPYECVVREYDKGNKDLIAKAIDTFDWGKVISGRCVNKLQKPLFADVLQYRCSF